MKKLWILLLVLSLFLPSISEASTYFVELTGNDTTGNGSSTTPWRTMNKCIAAMVAGDTCNVGDGLWTISGSTSMHGAINGLNPFSSPNNGTASLPITIKSKNPLGARIDISNATQANNYGFYTTRNYWIIEGFEIFGGTSNLSGGTNTGIYIQGTIGTIARKNWIHNIATTVCTAQGVATAGYQGIGTTQDTGTLIEKNIFNTIGRLRNGESGCNVGIDPNSGYYQNDHGIYVDESFSLTVQNNIFYDIWHGYSIHVFSSHGGTSTDFKLYNNTIADNIPQAAPLNWPPASITLYKITNADIRNNISYNSVSSFYICASGAVWSGVVVDHNFSSNGLFTNGCGTAPPRTETNNIINTNPLFVDSAGRNYQLQAGSLAINAGITLSSVPTDFIGIARPQGASYDIGAYERVLASTYWAAPAGSDTGPCTSSSTDPGVYLSIGRAAECATVSPWIINMKGTLGNYTQATHTVVSYARHLGKFVSGISAVNPNIVQTAPGEPQATLTFAGPWMTLGSGGGTTNNRSNITFQNFKKSGILSSGSTIFYAKGSNLTWQDCEMSADTDVNNFAAFGIQTSTSEGESTVIVRRCKFHDFTSYSVYGMPPNSIYEYNEVYNTRHAALQIQYDYDNTIVRYNYFHDILNRNATSTGCTAINVAGYTKNAFGPKAVGVQIYGNIFDPKCAEGSQSSAMVIYDTDSMLVANNIIIGANVTGSKAIQFITSGGDASSNVQLVNNIMLGPDAYPLITNELDGGGAGSATWTATFNACKSVHNCGTTGKQVITAITSCTISTTDYHLKTGTNPCVDTGTTVSSVAADKDGVTRPQGAAYDIGAYERVGGGTTFKTYYISPTGLDTRTCLQAQSSSTPKQTWKNAVACLATGDTLHALPGTYTDGALYEPVVNVPDGTLGNPTIIEGEGIGITISRPAASTFCQAWNLETPRYITIRRFTIDNINDINGCNNEGFHTGPNQGGSGNDLLMEDLEIMNAQGHGILGDVDRWTLRRVHFHHNGSRQALAFGVHGAYFGGSSINTLIEDSEFDHNGFVGGISASDSGVQWNTSTPSLATGVIMRRSYLHDNAEGGTFPKTVGAQIYNNVFCNNGAQDISFWIGSAGGLNNNLVYNNTFCGTSPTAVQFVGSGTGNKLVNNLIISPTKTQCYTEYSVPESPCTPWFSSNISNIITGLITDYTISSTDFHLKSGTNTAVDTGSSTVSSIVTSDKDGVARPQPVGGAYDIGAYERVPTPTGITYWISATGGNDLNSCASTSGTSDPGVYRATVDGGLSCLSSGDILHAKAGTYTGPKQYVNEFVRPLPNGTDAAHQTIIEGEGRGITIFRPDDGGFSATWNAQHVQWVTFRRFTIDAINNTGTNNALTLSDTAISPDAGGIGSDVLLEDLELKNAIDNGLLAKVDRLTMRRVYFHHNGKIVGGRHGFYLSTGSNNTLIENSEFAFNGTVGSGGPSGGQWNIGGTDGLARGVIYRYNYSHDNVQAGHAFRTFGAQIYGNIFANNNAADVQFWGSGASNNLVYNNTMVGTTSVAVQNCVSDPGCTGTLVTNNILLGTTAPTQGTGLTLTTNWTTAPVTTCTVSSTDLSLKSGANPCVDTGTTLSSVPFDYVGISRPQGLAFDIGAYERPSNTYYVATTGSDSRTCTQALSPSTPKQTIIGGLSCLTSAGTVLEIAGGTYSGGSNIIREVNFPVSGNSTAPIIIRGATGATVILDGAFDATVRFQDGTKFWITLSNLIIDGTAATNPATTTNLVFLGSGSHHITLDSVIVRNAPFHGMIATGDNHTFRNIQVLNNGKWATGAGAHGLVGSMNNSLIDGGVFSNNQCIALLNYGVGNAVTTQGSVIRKVKVFNNGTGKATGSPPCNSGETGGIYVGDLTSLIENVLVYNNDTGIHLGELDAGTTNQSGSRVLNSTIVGNNEGIKVESQDLNAEVRSSIIYNNVTDILNLGATLTQTNNFCTTAFHAGCTRTGDPLFVSLATFDLHLTAASSAIDSAPSIFLTSLVDFEGNVRPQGSAFDIGAYEFTGTPTPPGFPGGFIEKQGITTRPKVNPATFVPPTRGGFNFPFPYSTRGIRITNASDCPTNQDCVWYVGYSYWMNMNNHTASNDIQIFLGLDQNLGGIGTTLFRINKITEQVTKVGNLFPVGAYRNHTGEGIYWSGTLQDVVYVLDISNGRTLNRYNVLSQVFTPVFTIVNRVTGCTTASCPMVLQQAHSTPDDNIHVATLRNTSTGVAVGCLTYQVNTDTIRTFNKIGTGLPSNQGPGFFDECNIDKSGRWVIMLEDSNSDGNLDHRVFDQTTGSQVLNYTTNLGTLGHLDTGYNYVVGADNFNPLPNASIRWDLSTSPTQGPVVHRNPDFNTGQLNHPTHQNAISGQGLSQQMVCGSGFAAATVEADIVCVRADGTTDQLVVAPIMTLDSASGGHGGDPAYSKQPKGNIDVSGRYFIWTSNLGGNRLDAFLVKIPADLLITVDTIAPIAPTQVDID